MFEIYVYNKFICKLSSEEAVAAFYAGIMAAGKEPVDFDLYKDGVPTIKTFIIQKYFPDRIG